MSSSGRTRGIPRFRVLASSLPAAAVLLGAAPALAAEPERAGIAPAAPVGSQAPDGEPAAETAAATPAAGKAGKGDKAAKPGPEQTGPRQAQISIRLKGLRGGRVTAGKRIKIAGTLRPYVKGVRVVVVLKRGKQTHRRRIVKVRPKGGGSKLGQFSYSKQLIRPGRYSAQALHPRSRRLTFARDGSRTFRIRYPQLRRGSSGAPARVFNDLLDRRGYVPNGGSRFGSATGRAVLAFRKVNQMARNEKASGKIFKKLAKGKGGFKLKHPGAGKHVEADISRQVLVLARKGKAIEIYPTSSGAPATPTIRGKFRFYRKDPGYNSLGMYYSAYFIRGYATHGYQSVPTYPASHGCLRTPIPDARHIYNWIDIGDPIYVYG